MADDIILDARMGHAINTALKQGDLDAFFAHFAQYLANNSLKVPIGAIDDLARNGLIETQ